MGEGRPTSSAEATLEALADPVVVVGASGVVEYLNRAACELFGCELADLAGAPAERLFPERLQAVEGAAILDWLSAREPRDRAVRLALLRADGVEIHQSIRVSVTTVESGRAVVLVMGPRAETDLDLEPAGSPEPTTAQRMQAVFDAVPVGALHFDAHGRITDMNDLFVYQMGSSRGILTGLDMRTLPNEGVASAVTEALEGNEAHYEGEYTSVTGNRTGLYRAIFSPILRDGVVDGGVGIVEDITERTEIERRLAQGERMASLGRLAAGVAHEINNPLAYVRTSLDIARREVVRMELDPEDPSARRLIEAIDRAEDGVERVRVIAGDLKTFSRGDDSSWVPVDLGRVAEAAVNLARNELRHRATLEREIEEVPPVMGSETRFVQVLVNLLVNAAQAFDADGAPPPEEARVILRIGAVTEDRVFVEVEDNGPGMDPSIVSHVFEPFWTSKSTGVGTGLGLSICHGIVTAAEGEIRVARSAPGAGTTFRIELPASPNGARRRSSARRPPRPTPSRRHRIMVVDDEPQLGVALRVALSERYDVTVSGSGHDALGRLERGARFDLILCDLMMPKMSGMDLYEAALERVPSAVTRFVFMTGGAFTERAKAFLAEHGVPHLQKPFGIEEVHALLVRRMLG